MARGPDDTAPGASALSATEIPRVVAPVSSLNHPHGNAQIFQSGPSLWVAGRRCYPCTLLHNRRRFGPRQLTRKPNVSAEVAAVRPGSKRRPSRKRVPGCRLASLTELQ
jgi:hypothetical protein